MKSSKRFLKCVANKEKQICFSLPPWQEKKILVYIRSSSLNFLIIIKSSSHPPNETTLIILVSKFRMNTFLIIFTYVFIIFFLFLYLNQDSFFSFCQNIWTYTWNENTWMNEWVNQDQHFNSLKIFYLHKIQKLLITEGFY